MSGSTDFGKPLTPIMYNVGLRTAPCGTPLTSSCVSEKELQCKLRILYTVKNWI